MSPKQQYKQPGSLSDDEIRSIFRSIHDSQAKCEREYTVIDSGPKLSFQIPAFGFREGIYVLFSIESNGFPRHLHAKVVDPSSFGHFKWKTSGPRKSVPSDLQWRYCYPTSGVGELRGNLWTKVVNGKDDLSIRIFHVLPHSPTTQIPRQLQKQSHCPDVDDGCMKCGIDNDWPNMLQCSFCERTHCHTYCLGLDTVPAGDWFCSDICRQNFQCNSTITRNMVLEGQECGNEDESENEHEEKSVSNWSEQTNAKDEKLSSNKPMAKQASKRNVNARPREPQVLPTEVTMNQEAQPSSWQAALCVSEIVPAAGQTAKRPQEGFTMAFAPPKRARTMPKMDLSEATREEDVAVQPDVVQSTRKAEVIVIDGDYANHDDEEDKEEDSKLPPKGKEEAKIHSTNQNVDRGIHESSNDVEEDSKLPPDGSAGRPLLLDVCVKQEDDASTLDAAAADDDNDLAGGTADADNSHTDVYFRLTRRETSVVGWVTVKSRSATFADLRAIINNELDLTTRPWTFYFPSLGPVHPSQETSLGSVAHHLEGANDESLGDGTFLRPFRLSILM